MCWWATSFAGLLQPSEALPHVGVPPLPVQDDRASARCQLFVFLFFSPAWQTKKGVTLGERGPIVYHQTMMTQFCCLCPLKDMVFFCFHITSARCDFHALWMFSYLFIYLFLRSPRSRWLSVLDENWSMDFTRTSSHEVTGWTWHQGISASFGSGSRGVLGRIFYWVFQKITPETSWPSNSVTRPPKKGVNSCYFGSNLLA